MSCFALLQHPQLPASWEGENIPHRGKAQERPTQICLFSSEGRWDCIQSRHECAVPQHNTKLVEGKLSHMTREDAGR